MYGIETRAALVESSRALAARSGFNDLSFLNLVWRMPLPRRSSMCRSIS